MYSWHETSYRPTPLPERTPPEWRHLDGDVELEKVPHAVKDYLKKHRGWDGTAANFKAHLIQPGEKVNEKALRTIKPGQKFHRLVLSVSNSQELPPGLLLAYFPQPFETVKCCTGFVAVGKDKKLVVPVPPDRLNNFLWFHYFAYTPVEGTQQPVLTRQATGALHFSPNEFEEHSTHTVDLFHVNTNHQGPHLTLNLVCLQAYRRTFKHVVECQYEWTYHEKTASLYTAMDANAVSDYLFRMNQYLDHAKHTNVGLPPWLVVGESFQNGTLPLWSFIMEYTWTGPLSLQQELAAVLTLGRMVSLCRFKGRFPRDHQSMKGSDWCELLGDVMALLPLSTTYCTDKRRIYTNKSDNDRYYLQDHEAAASVQEDQWVHSLVCPNYSEHGYDCEDGAATAIYVFHMLKRLRAQAVAADPWLEGLWELTQLYVCFLAVGTLVLPGDKLTYHAFPLLVDELNVQLRAIKDKAPGWGRHLALRTPKQLKLFDLQEGGEVRREQARLPTMAVETTESTSSCLNFDRDPENTIDLFSRARPDCPLVRCKVPTGIMKDAHQYRHLLFLLAPQLYPEYGIVEWAVESLKTGLGAPFQDVVSDFAEGSQFRMVLPAPVDPDTVVAVRQAVLQLPRTRGLPLSVDSTQEVLPAPHIEPDETLLLFNSRYRDELLPQLIEDSHQKGFSCRVFNQVRVARDLDLTYVALRPLPAEELKTGEENLQAYKSKLHRNFPVGGRYHLNRGYAQYCDSSHTPADSAELRGVSLTSD